jgi:hypothetical protein
MGISKRRIQSMKSIKSMKRRIQSMKSMKSMKNIKRKKGTRRAKSMGYKSIKSRKSRKSSVYDNSIETSINAIISDINKKNLSINDKIEMISNELSKLPTIKFYGSLYIPNLSSLDNEGDAIELHNGGMPPRRTEPEQTGRMTDKDLKRNNELKKTAIETKMKRLRNQIETLSKKNPITTRDSNKKTEAESELRKLQMELEDLEIENNKINARIKANERLQEETAKTEETEKEEQELKSEVERLRKICDEKIITPLTTIIGEAAGLDKNLRATINISANDENVETVLQEIIATANRKISKLREETEEASTAEEKNKETKREEELKELKRKGKKLDPYHEKMYIHGYEKATKVRSVNEYVRIFDQVNNDRSNLTRRLNDGLNGVKVVSRVLITTEDVDDTGSCWWFFDNSVEERHVRNPSQAWRSKFHLTVHLGKKIGMSDDPYMGKTHIVHRDHDITKREESVNMYPYNFSRTKTRPETDNNIGPDTCMQVIPIFPPGAVNKDIKISIATILNTFLYELQIKKHSDTLWDRTKQTSHIDIRFQEYQESLETKSNRIKRRLRIRELTKFIAKAIEIIETMSKLFLMLLHNDYKHCIEHIKVILKRCQNFLNNLPELLKRHRRKINDMSDDDGNNDHITNFEEAMRMNSKKLTELTEDTTIAPDIEEILGKITNALSNLDKVEVSNLDKVEGEVEAEVEAEVESEVEAEVEGEVEAEVEGEADELYTSFRAQLNNDIENIDIEDDAKRAIKDHADTIFKEKIGKYLNNHNSKFPNKNLGIKMGIDAINEAKQKYDPMLPQTQPTPSAQASEASSRSAVSASEQEEIDLNMAIAASLQEPRTGPTQGSATGPSGVTPAAGPSGVTPAAGPSGVTPAAAPAAPTTRSQGKQRVGRGRKNKITRKKTNKYSIYKIKSKINKNKQK